MRARRKAKERARRRLRKARSKNISTASEEKDRGIVHRRGGTERQPCKELPQLLQPTAPIHDGLLSRVAIGGEISGEGLEQTGESAEEEVGVVSNKKTKIEDGGGVACPPADGVAEKRVALGAVPDKVAVSSANNPIQNAVEQEAGEVEEREEADGSGGHATSDYGEDDDFEDDVSVRPSL